MGSPRLPGQGVGGCGLESAAAAALSWVEWTGPQAQILRSALELAAQHELPEDNSPEREGPPLGCGDFTEGEIEDEDFSTDWTSLDIQQVWMGLYTQVQLPGKRLGPSPMLSDSEPILMDGGNARLAPTSGNGTTTAAAH